MKIPSSVLVQYEHNYRAVAAPLPQMPPITLQATKTIA
jgi:hypothetical protein